MKIYNTKRAGISLVALVVTIIVLIILTGAVIVTFMEGGIVDRAKEAVFKSDIKTYQEILAVKRAEELIEISVGTGGASELNGTTAAEIQVFMPEFKEEYEGIIKVVDGAIVLVEEYEEVVSDLQKEWLEDLALELEPLDISSIELTCDKYLGIGKTKKITANTDVEWSSSDENILKVAEDGTITGVAEGTAVVTATKRNLTAEVTVIVSTLRTATITVSYYYNSDTEVEEYTYDYFSYYECMTWQDWVDEPEFDKYEGQILECDDEYHPYGYYIELVGDSGAKRVLLNGVHYVDGSPNTLISTQYEMLADSYVGP